MTQETRNIMVATCLSLLVVLGWDAFYARPHLDKERQTQAEMHARATPGAQPGPQASNSQATRSQASGLSAPAPGEASTPQKSRADALAESPRVKLDAPAIYGSIALKGGRIDDVSFKAYRETVDPNSPNIVLLSPAGSPSPYYAEAGFIADPGANLVLPGPDTLWQADHDTLTETSPVTLTYDNGQGLVFHRKIAVDDRYMFTVTDSVENKSTQAVTLHPYAFVKRHGRPVSTGIYRVHEGFVGVIGEFRRAGDQVRQDRKGRSCDEELRGYRRLARPHRQILGRGGHSGPGHGCRGKLFWIRRRSRDLSGWFCRNGRTDACAGRFERIHVQALRGCQGDRHARQISGQFGDQEVRSADRLGLVLFYHQADVPTCSTSFTSLSAISESRSCASRFWSRDSFSRSPTGAIARWPR